MQKRLQTLRLICNNVGVIALFIYVLLFVIGSHDKFLMTRVFAATSALILYSIKFGAEIVSNEYIRSTIILVLMCLFNFIISIILLSL